MLLDHSQTGLTPMPVHPAGPYGFARDLALATR